MDGVLIERRLAAMETILQGILAALAPPEADGASGFDDLVEAMSDLTVAVAEVADKVEALRSTGCGPRPGHAAS